VIFIGDADGEIAREVARGQCGVTVSPDDPVQLAKAIKRLCDGAAACAPMGANARAMFEAEYSQAIAVGKWRAVLKEVQGT
jgi:colanic acid biosynthesis glycosyl transferase WcaI